MMAGVVDFPQATSPANPTPRITSTVTEKRRVFMPESLAQRAAERHALMNACSQKTLAHAAKEAYN